MKFPGLIVASALLGGAMFARADSAVVFNEIMYHPRTNEAQLEWVELQNQQAVDVDLSGWSLVGGVGFQFSEGTVISAGAYLLVASAPVALNAATGLANVAGPFVGRLSNAGDKLQLHDRNGRTIDEVNYGVEGDWPVAPDGAGPSLARRRANVRGADPRNWRPSAQFGGTPGLENFPTTAAVVLTNTLVPIAGVWRFNDSGVDLGTGWRAAGYNDSGWSSGPGLFFREEAPLPAPKNTPLAPGRVTYYFRTQFVFTGDVSRVELRLRPLVDDGALGYLNGVEIFRVNMPAGAVTSSTLANGQVGDATFGETMVLPPDQLIRGTNVLAVEVHQAPSAVGYPQAVLNSGPLGYWRLGENGGTALDSASAAGAPQSGAQNGAYQDFAAANLAQPGPRPTDSVNARPLVGFEANNFATRFAGNGDGGNDVVRIPDPGVFNFAATRRFTLEAWVNALPPQGDYGAIIGKGAGGGGEQYTIDMAATGNYRLFIWDGGNPNTPVECHSSAVVNGTWQHVVAVYDQPAGRMKFYVNGVETGSATPRPTLFDTPLEVTVGARKNFGSPNYDLNFDGRIDEVAIYNRALPVSEILAHFNAAFTNNAAAGADTNDVVFGLQIDTVETLPEPTLAFNELASSTNSAFWLELINSGAAAVDLGGYVIARLGGMTNREYTLPSQVLAPGGLLQVTKGEMGFGADSGDRLVLYTPDRLRVADAVVVKKDPRGRWPDSTGAWWFPTQPTPGASNAFTRHDELVINEIMYHHRELPPFVESPEAWVEIFNRSTQPVDLGGWRLDEGIDYRFAAGKTLAPGGYLVVAKDPAHLLALHPGLDVVGPFTNKLSRRSDYFVLKDPHNNPADEVRYFDYGPWPEDADGGGSSLELRDPHADNAKAEAWAASDESGKSGWQTYTWRGLAQAGQAGEPTLWHEFALCLLDGAGEALLDDLRVTETPATTPKQLLHNGSFNGGSAAHWRFLGTHRHSRVEPEPGNPGNYVLHLVATGPGEYQGNQIETTLTNNVAIMNAREYEISYRARWLAGKNKLNARLYFNRLARTFDLPMPARQGTPGAINSRFAANIGPTFSDLIHTPVVPNAGQPVTVSVSASDADGVASMTLKYSVNGAAWQGAPMSNYVSRSTFCWSASIPGQPAASVVQFFVEGLDTLGAVASFPARGTNSRALYVVQDNQATPGPLHNFRIIMTGADASFLHGDTNHQSNEWLGGTVVADEREAYYDVGVRLKGSFPGRDTTRVGYHITFNPDQPYRGVHESVAVDRAQALSVGLVGEIVVKHIANHAGGIPDSYDDLARCIAPMPAYTTTAQLRLSWFDADYLDALFNDGSEGPLFEVEGHRWSVATMNGNPESLKQPGNDFSGSDYANLEVQNYGNDKESYRWFFLCSHNRTADDYAGALSLSQLFSLTGANFDLQAPTVLDVDEWLRVMAYQTLLGPLDVYYTSVAVHNFRVYVRPQDQRVLYLPWDWDGSWLVDPSASLFGSGNIAKLVNHPHRRRLYLNHVHDIVTTTYNPAYMSRWITHYSAVAAQDMSYILDYISARSGYALSQLPTATAFAITSNNGNNFGTNSPAVTLTGTAPIDVRTIEINGVSYPVTWTSTTAWTVVVPLFGRTNTLVVQGVDSQGNRQPGALDTIIVTNTGTAAPLPSVINEWMAGNARPLGNADPLDGLFQDWFELFNPNTNAVNLTGFTLTDNLAQPAKWRVPTNTFIAPRGFLLVWADNQTNQNSLNTNGHLHAGFQLNDGGEAIGFFAPYGTPQHVVIFGAQIENVSQGLFPDGATNVVYFMTNFTPRAANSLAGPLRLTEISVNAGVVTLKWGAIPGRSYRVQFKNSLSETPWLPLTSDLPAAASTASVMDLINVNTQRAYRVLRLD